MYLPMNVAHPELAVTFERVFRAFLAHELHHCARRSVAGFAETLGQALVTEGLACCFESELPGVSVPLYAKRTSGEALRRLRDRAVTEQDLPLSGWGEWFFGEREPEVPMHAGYSIGYAIVSRWLASHGRTAAESYATPASRILAEAARPD